MQSVMRRWPPLTAALERLISCCVDLKETIQAAVYLPVPSFSIKCVAPTLGFHWRQNDIGAYQAMSSYWDYLDNKDLFAIHKAIIYNEDDCMAMWHVDQELATRLIPSRSWILLSSLLILVSLKPAARSWRPSMCPCNFLSARDMKQ
jgi:hypothetical protein